MIMLPLNKYTSWRQDTINIISKGKVNKSTMESLLGRLNHAAYLNEYAQIFHDLIKNGSTKDSASQIYISES
jgi:hypothetical protein